MYTAKANALLLKTRAITSTIVAMQRACRGNTEAILETFKFGK